MDNYLPDPEQKSIPTKSEFVEPKLTKLGNLGDITTMPFSGGGGEPV